MINVIDISITPNRGDCFSIRGIAREIGVINQLTVTAPEINAVAATIADEKKVVVSTEGCPRYLGRVIKKREYQSSNPRVDGTCIGSLRDSSAQYFG